MRLPTVLENPEDDGAVAVIEQYYGLNGHNPNGYTGASFDTWDSTGTRRDDTNQFTADDLVAVSMLSVDVPAAASIRLLNRGRAQFSELLEQVGPDRDLVEEERELDDHWVGWALLQSLRELPGVGPTTATKLFARKRPRLRPIYDSVVAEVAGTTSQWEPMRQLLRADGAQLHRLVAIRRKAKLDQHADYISPLRMWDVLAWMQGKGEQPDAPTSG
jgi:hypothetical protein